MNNKEKESKYLKYLPAIYQAENADRGSFLGRFLKAFEKILSGIADEDSEPEGIEEILDKIHTYFDPFTTPVVEFLPWLAGWVGLILQEGEGWEEEKKRKHVAQIVSLYRKRGTREGLEEYIRIYVGEEAEVSINEFLYPLRIGFSSTVGVDTFIGQGRPYYFHVYMELPAPDPILLKRKGKAIIDIIDQEKPAHTYYDLTIKVPTMQIGVYSRVGVDTLLGGLIKK